RPMPETLNSLNQQGLAPEYAELLSGFTRSGMLERKRLQALGSALRSRYVLLPGLAGFDEALGDSFEISGLKIVRSRVSTLRLWLQLLDTPTGGLLWGAAGGAGGGGGVPGTHPSRSLQETREQPLARRP